MAHRQTDSKMIETHKKGKVAVKDDTPIIIKRENGRLIISISLDHIQNTSNFDIVKTISLATSPIFTNKNKISIEKSIKEFKITGFPHVAFFIEDMGHYTGGRYSFWLQAVILSHFTKVTVISNSKPIFYDDFKSYLHLNENFCFIQDKSFQVSVDENDYDIVIGVPNISGQFATDYAEKWKLPLYLVMFETPNWIRQYRDGVDAHDDFWESYKKCLEKADYIIVPSNESAYWFGEWMPNKNIQVIYPCINELVANKVKAKMEKDFRIIFTSRMSPFKNPTSIFKALPKEIKCIMIGKIWKDDKKRLDKLIAEGHNIEMLESVSDVVKFEEMQKASLLVHPSKFEGFGMPPMEALYYNKPVITFDLPVLREVYGNSINYVELGKRKEFIQKIKEVHANPAKFVPKPLKNEFFHINYNLQRQKEIFNMPKITFGILAYNCADYIEYAIKSIYNLAHHIIIIEGSVEGYGNTSTSNDDTNKIINKLQCDDPYKKILIIKNDGKWKDKIEMQNAIAEHVDGDFYIKMDADEIWKPETVMAVINIMINNPNIMTIRMPFLHFWTSFDVVAEDAGGKWGTKHHRVWRWKKSYKHRKSFNHFIDTKNDNKPVVSPYVEEMIYTGDSIYHFGYCREKKYIQEKLNYYRNRGIEKIVIDTYSNWKELSDPTQPTQKVNSFAVNFDVNKLPLVLRNHPYWNVEDVRKIGG
ncbi:MAG: glycosyltransferase [Candidatus Hodarchaeales archaeon]